MTPDELRNLTKGNPHPAYIYITPEIILAAADAWEAQVKGWEDAYHERDRAYNVLVKRLEAAEKVRQAAINYRNCADNYLLLSDPFDKFEATHRLEYDRWLGELDAALAGEEK